MLNGTKNDYTPSEIGIAIDVLADLGATNEVIENLNQITAQEVENVAKYMNLQYDDVIDLVNQYDI